MTNPFIYGLDIPLNDLRLSLLSLIFLSALPFPLDYLFVMSRKCVTCLVVSDPANPWTIALQTPQSMEFSR